VPFRLKFHGQLVTGKREALTFLRNRSAPEVTFAGRHRQLEAASVAGGRGTFLPPSGVHCVAAHGY
jgi:hypothetical protein